MFLLKLFLPKGFHWWHVFVPVLPNGLLEVIEAPVPLMVGLRKEQVYELQDKLKVDQIRDLDEIYTEPK